MAKINSVRIKIGRNYSSTNQPMTIGLWESFKGEIADLIIRSAVSIGDDFFDEGIDSTGEWNDTIEENFEAYVTGLVDVDYDYLVEELQRLKEFYGQDAISLTTGLGELI